MNNDPTQNNNSNYNNGNHNDDNDFKNNVSKYYWKFRKNDIFCCHNFGGAIATQGVICHKPIKKGVIKLQ